ncbi:MAG: Opr family porin [Campylobacteraceae bacterium]|nr:Opr family porin [Campylobacteraceae bacterium]
MKRKYSIVLASLLVGAVSLIGAEESLEEAFKNGEIKGNVALYGQSQKMDEGTPSNYGFGSGSTTLSYETAPLHGVSLGMGAWGVTKLGEKNDDDYKNAIAKNALISEAYIKVEQEGMGKAIVGRQSVDLEWMSDFVDGAMFELSAIENLTLTLGWAKKYAVINFDEVSSKFEKINGNDGVFVVDAKYTPIEWLELNPYYYYASDMLSALGLKTTLSAQISEDIKTQTALQYVKVNSAIANTPDGYVTRLEQGVELYGATLALGYVKVDKDSTAGLGAFGDKMPLEEGNHMLDPNAKTPYLSAKVDIEGVKLSALYGETKYFDAINLKEKEINLGIGYEFMKHLEGELIYADIKNDANADSYQVVKALLKYEF